MTSTVTHGLVVVEDGVRDPEKTGDQYAPTRKVRVEIGFTVPEGASGEGCLDLASRIADAKVNQLLGRKLTVDEKIVAAVEAHETGKGTRRSRTTRATAEPAPAAPAADLDGAPTEAAPAAAEPTSGIDDIGSTSSNDDLSGDVGDIGGIDDLTVAAEEPITDAELNSAVQARNTVIKNPTAIKALIASYRTAPGPFNLAMIPQSSRRDFLSKLEALQAAG